MEGREAKKNGWWICSDGVTERGEKRRSTVDKGIWDVVSFSKTVSKKSLFKYVYVSTVYVF